MTRTVNLLSEDAYRRLVGPEGLDVVGEPQAFREMADCGYCGGTVTAGVPCPNCFHGCEMPGDPTCPAHEE